MSALPYHKRYHGDALTGFMALTLEERGAYQTLLDLIYDRGGPIMDDERLLAGYMKCSLRKWRAIRDELIAKRKIRITRDGHIHNDRAEKEIENNAKTSRKLAESGSKGGRNRAKSAEAEKKPNEINEGEQASLEPASSDPQAIRATLPEARDHIEGSEDKGSSGAEAPPIDPIKAMFDAGVALLTTAGVPDKQARSLIGKWRGQANDDEVRLAIAEAQVARITDPVPWLSKRLSGTRRPNGAPPQRHFEDIVEEEYRLRESAAGGPS